VPSDIQGENHKSTRHLKGEKPSENDVTINSTSIKINEHSGLTKILPKISFDAPCKLDNILDIPSPIISDSELLDCLRIDEFLNDFTMEKCKVHSKEDEITVEPQTKARFDLVGKTKLEICMHNIRKEKVNEPSW